MRFPLSKEPGCNLPGDSQLHAIDTIRHAKRWRVGGGKQVPYVVYEYVLMNMLRERKPI